MDGTTFSHFDWLVLGTYLAAMLAIGLRFSSRQTNSREFFLGSRRFSPLTISLSLLATALSAITYVGIPGLACEQDWRLFLSGAIAVVSMVCVARYFMPFFYNLKLPSVYEYLRLRFDTRMAVLGGVIFLAVRGLVAGIAIYAPSVALAAVAGWNLHVCVVVFGLLTICYTALGGMSAVVWTDVIQAIVLMLGAFVCLFILYTGIAMPPSEMIAVLAEERKFNIVDLRWSWVEMTFWAAVIGGFAYNLAFYGTDQVLLQRCMASRSLKASQQSLHLNALYIIPVILVFFTIGSLLYLFRRAHPQSLPEGLPLDQVFPYFIAHQLPAGVSGLLIAAIFAAAMSTLSSILNSLSTVTVTDYIKRFILPGRDDAQYTTIAKITTAVWGIAAIVLALFTDRLNESVALAALKAGGLFTGPILGAFLMGIFLPSITPTGAFLGTLLGMAVSLPVGFFTPLEPFWVLCGSCLLTFGVAAAVSAMAPMPAEDAKVRRQYTWFECRGRTR